MTSATKAHRVRRFLKPLRVRIFLAFLLLVLSLFISSTCLTITREVGTLHCGVHAGSFFYRWLHNGPPTSTRAHWYIHWNRPSLENQWKLDIPTGPMLTFGKIIFPLWPSIPLAAVLSTPLMILKRKRPTGCHRCGYSRLGLRVDATCPECGATFNQSQPQP